MEAELRRRRQAARPARPDPSSPASVIGDLLDRARYADYFECLGVARDAGTTQVREAWLTLSARLADLRAGTADIPGAADALDQVERVAADAFEVLSDPDLRLAYLRAGD